MKTKTMLFLFLVSGCDHFCPLGFCGFGGSSGDAGEMPDHSITDLVREGGEESEMPFVDFFADSDVPDLSSDQSDLAVSDMIGDTQDDILAFDSMRDDAADYGVSADLVRLDSLFVDQGPDLLPDLSKPPDLSYVDFSALPDLRMLDFLVSDLAKPLAPVLISVTPSSGSSGAQVTVRGMNFQQGIKILFANVVAQQVQYVSSMELKATVPVVPCGKIDVKVENPDTQYAILSAAFSYVCATVAFGPPGSYPVGLGPLGMVAGDWNNDRKLDIAVVDQTGESVFPLMNRGDGSFTVGQSVKVGKSPMAVATGDWNSDGKADLVVVNSVDGTVSILRGDGAGGFAAVTMYRTGTGPVDVVVGDWNVDSKMDIAVAHGSGTVRILNGLGDGNFVIAEEYSAGLLPVHVLGDDCSGDRIPDLFVENEGAGFSFLLNLGNGKFNQAISAPPSPMGSGTPHGIGLRDLNGDGNLDVVISYGNGGGWNGLWVYTGKGKCVFSSPEVIRAASGDSAPGLSINDWNCDDRFDVITTNLRISELSVFLGDGKGSFVLPIKQIKVNSQPIRLISGDWNNDGKPDVAVASQSAKTVQILLNTSF